MIVTGDGDIPLYLKIDSGNIDDKSVFVSRLKEFKKRKDSGQGVLTKMIQEGDY